MFNELSSFCGEFPITAVVTDNLFLLSLPLPEFVVCSDVEGSGDISEYLAGFVLLCGERGIALSDTIGKFFSSEEEPLLLRTETGL